MTRFTINERSQPRFENDFEVRPAPGIKVTPAEQSYLNGLAKVLAKLEAETKELTREPHPASIGTAFSSIRAQTIRELRGDADEFAAGRLSEQIAYENALVVKGLHRGEVQRLFQSLFTVDIVPGKDPSLAIDLDIKVQSGLPPPNAEPSQAQQDLYVGIKAALTVVKTVCRRMKEAHSTWFRRSRAPQDHQTKRADELLDEYVRQLREISVLGLVDQQTPTAMLALASLRQEFVAREAGRIKNGYVGSLALAAGTAASLSLVLYILVEGGYVNWAWGQRHSAFALAVTGAAMGTWLSFSVRNVELPFEQLGQIESDLLRPGLRVLFVVGLTFAAYLLFWTGAVSVAIGDLQVNPVGFASAGSIALLMGLFCGLSERALATVISGRAASFVGTIAGAR